MSFTSPGPDSTGVERHTENLYTQERFPGQGRRKKGRGVLGSLRKGDHRAQRYFGDLESRGKGPRKAARTTKRKPGSRWVIVRQPHLTATPLSFWAPKGVAGSKGIFMCPRPVPSREGA